MGSSRHVLSRGALCLAFAVIVVRTNGHLTLMADPCAQFAQAVAAAQAALTAAQLAYDAAGTAFDQASQAEQIAQANKLTTAATLIAARVRLEDLQQQNPPASRREIEAAQQAYDAAQTAADNAFIAYLAAVNAREAAAAELARKQADLDSARAVYRNALITLLRCQNEFYNRPEPTKTTQPSPTPSNAQSDASQSNRAARLPSHVRR